MPERDRVLIVLEPVGDESDAGAKELAHQAGDRAVDVPLHRGDEPFTGQSRQRQVRPMPDEITQLRPALKRDSVEVFLGDEVAQRKVVAAVYGEIVVGDVAVVSQAKLASRSSMISAAA